MTAPAYEVVWCLSSLRRASRIDVPLGHSWRVTSSNLGQCVARDSTHARPSPLISEVFVTLDVYPLSSRRRVRPGMTNEGTNRLCN